MEDEHIIESEHTLARRVALSLRAHGAGACPSELELAGYLDGLASEAEGERIEAHLAACAECRQAIEVARQDPDLLIPGHDPLVLEKYPDGRIA